MLFPVYFMVHEICSAAKSPSEHWAAQIYSAVLTGYPALLTFLPSLRDSTLEQTQDLLLLGFK